MAADEREIQERTQQLITLIEQSLPKDEVTAAAVFLAGVILAKSLIGLSKQEYLRLVGALWESARGELRSFS